MSVTPTLPICVKPYPNELLYGWLIRLAKINMYPSAESFCERYFPQDGPKYEINEHKMIRPDYRFNLDNVCKWYENIRCFPDAMTILHDMTPYFTVAPFLTRGYQVMRSQAILREQTGGILDILLSGKLAEVPSVRLDETFNPVERRNIHISGCCCGRLFKGQRPPCRLHGGL